MEGLAACSQEALDFRWASEFIPAQMWIPLRAAQLRELLPANLCVVMTHQTMDSRVNRVRSSDSRLPCHKTSRRTKRRTLRRMTRRSTTGKLKLSQAMALAAARSRDERGCSCQPRPNARPAPLLGRET